MCASQTASQVACPIASSWAEQPQAHRWTRPHVMDVIAVVEIADVLVLVMGEVLHVWLARWRKK